MTETLKAECRSIDMLQAILKMTVLVEKRVCQAVDLSRFATSRGGLSVGALLLITMIVPQVWPEARLWFLWQVSPLPELRRGQATVWSRDLCVEGIPRVCTRRSWAASRQSCLGGEGTEGRRRQISDVFPVTLERSKTRAPVSNFGTSAVPGMGWKTS